MSAMMRGRFCHQKIWVIALVLSFFAGSCLQGEITLEHRWTRLADSEGAVDKDRSTASAEAAEFSPDGSLIVAGSKGRLVQGQRQGQRVTLWNLDGELLWKKDRADEVEAVAFSPDGKFIAAGGEDLLVEIYQVYDDHGNVRPVTIASLQHDAGIDGLRFSNDGALLATGAEDQNIRLFSTQNWQVLTTVSHGGTGDNAVNQLDFTNDDSVLVSAGSNGKLRIWDLETTTSPNGETVDAKLLPAHELDQKASSKSVRVSPDGAYIASGSAGNKAAGGAQGTRVWDLAGNLVGHIQATGWIMETVEWSPDGKYLLTGGNEGEVNDAGNGRFALKAGNLANSRHGIGHIHIYALTDILEGVPDPLDPTETLNVDPETYNDFSGRLPGVAVQPVSRLEIFRQEYLHFSQDGRWLVTSHEDGSIRLFHVSDR